MKKIIKKPTKPFIDRLVDFCYPENWADTWPLYSVGFDKQLQSELGFIPLAHLALHEVILQQAIDFTGDKFLDFPVRLD